MTILIINAVILVVLLVAMILALAAGKMSDEGHLFKK